MKRSIALLAAVLSSAVPALAVKTQHFTQTSADDFKKGTSHNVVATSTGQLRLSRKIDALLPKDRHIDAIQAIAEAPDGAIVFSTFPGGEVLSLKAGKLTTLATFKDQTVTALAYDKQGRLLIGVGGEKAILARIDTAGAQPTTVCEPEEAKYVWSILPDGDDVFLGTGPGGGVFKMSGDKAESFAELDGDNVLCLTADKASIYAGTDADACVVKIDRKTAKPYVLYEAAESEISALAWDSHGNLLAATSEPHDAAAAPDDKSGDAAPVKKPAGLELPGKKPTPPKPPEDKPDDAIPRSTKNSAMPKPEVPASAPAGDSDAAKDDASKGDDTAPASNAVYRIDPRGLVTEIFRKPVIIYGMAVRGEKLVLATGDDGEVYEVDPETGDESILLRADAPDATGLLSGRDGTLYVATSNAGEIYRLSAGLAKEGTFESEALDAATPSTFGQLHLLGTLPDGTSLTVQTRAGNTEDPDGGDWADWTSPVPAKAFVPVTSGPARFLQYRLTFASNDVARSAVVDEVDITYQKPNLPPKISGVTVAPEGDAAGRMAITWEATDGNDDELRYAVAVRAVGGPWMKIADDLTDMSHAWSSKGVPDGQYEVKVTASDAAANPPGEGREASRTSDGVLVDNTPPVIGDVKTTVDGHNATITLRVVDRAGTVASVETTLDQIEHWQKRLPDDNMADSPEERYTVPLDGLSKGSHALMVRATDSRGNASYETVTVTVP